MFTLVTLKCFDPFSLSKAKNWSAFSVVNSAQLSGKAGAVEGEPVYDFGVEKKRTS